MNHSTASKRSHTDIPLVVDLDGTLISTDLFWRSVRWALLHRPYLALAFPYWLCKGKAAFKRALALRVPLSPESLPFNHSLLEKIKARAATGSPILLATGSDSHYAEQVSVHLGIFAECLASDGANNFVSLSKATTLVARYGKGGFDYVGNSRQDLHVWKHSRQAWIVGASEKLVRNARQISNVTYVEESVPSERDLSAITDPLVWLILLCSIAPQAIPAFIHTDVIADDFRQHFLHFFRAQNSALFPNDLIVDYYQQRFGMPLHRFLFSSLTAFMDPQRASESVGLILAILTGFTLIKLNRVITGASARMSALIIAFSSLIVRTEPSLNWIVICESAQQGSFAVILMGGFFIGFIKRAWTACAVAALGCVGVYPPAAIVLVVWLILKPDTWNRTLSRDSLGIKSVLGILVAGLLILKSYIELDTPPGTGPFEFSAAIQMPEFTSKQGILPFLRFDAAGLYRSFLPYKTLSTLYLALCVTVLMTFRKRFPIIFQVAGSLLLAGFLTWLAATITFEKLFEPSRYSFLAFRFVLLLGTMAIAAVIHEYLQKTAFWISLVRKLTDPRLITAGAVAMTVICLSATTASALQKRGGTLLTVLPNDIYDYFRQQPLNVIIGGTPYLLSDIMIRSLRSVVAIPHLIYPYDKHYYPIFKRRIIDMLFADCFISRNVLSEVKDKYQVRFFVTEVRDRNSFASGWRYAEPFASIITQRLSEGQACTRTLDDDLSKLIVKKSGPIAVLDLSLL